MRGLVSMLIETQLKKLEIKVRHFEELETLMESERSQLETQRRKLIEERQNFQQHKAQVIEVKERKIDNKHEWHTLHRFRPFMVFVFLHLNFFVFCCFFFHLCFCVGVAAKGAGARGGARERHRVVNCRRFLLSMLCRYTELLIADITVRV